MHGKFVFLYCEIILNKIIGPNKTAIAALKKKDSNINFILLFWILYLVSIKKFQQFFVFKYFQLRLLFSAFKLTHDTLCIFVGVFVFMFIIL
jgi:hypothetical protein